ncbi:hypothetical protein CL617_00100, partial [archaeon]|nr:hypothetical protein [archaeon]
QITLAKNNNNTIRFLEKIGYRYCNDKEKQGLLWLEYLKARLYEKQKRENLKLKALNLQNRRNIGKTKISKILNIKEYEARSYIYENYRPGVPKKFDSFDEWMNKRLSESFIFEKIGNIEKMGNEDVYDITVEDTHNFIANNIISHNCHEFLPKKGKTPATDALVQLLREGRQPGISLVLATQQPGQIHKDVMTQSDIVLSHRLTAKFDIEALKSIMQTYLNLDILSYLNNLPRLKGSAIILDDNSERIYPMRTRPKMSWHGGSAPSSVKINKKELLDLKLE